MQRRETLQLLREIGECLDSTPIFCVFLENRNKSDLASLDDYEIRIKASFDLPTRNFIQKIARKHKFLLKESNGFLVIYSPERELLEITA